MAGSLKKIPVLAASLTLVYNLLIYKESKRMRAPLCKPGSLNTMNQACDHTYHTSYPLIFARTEYLPARISTIVVLVLVVGLNVSGGNLAMLMYDKMRCFFWKLNQI